MEKTEYENIYKNENTYWWYVAFHELIEFYVKKFKIEDSELKILDAGCGCGGMLQRLVKYGSVNGFDYSIDAIEYCKLRGFGFVEKVDLNNWIPTEEMYDIVVCSDVLYHSEIKDDAIILKKFDSALRTNGILILSNPAFNKLKRQHDAVVWGARRYSVKIVLSMIKNTRFKIIRKTYRLPMLYILIRIQQLIGRKNKYHSDLSGINPILNQILLFINRLENFLIRIGLTLPFGSSLFVILKKINSNTKVDK